MGFLFVYLFRAYFFPCAAWGSCWRMARMAVGAVNMEEAPCSDRTRKNAPGSGVPTGFPCDHTNSCSADDMQKRSGAVTQTTAENSRLKGRISDPEDAEKPSLGRGNIYTRSTKKQTATNCGVNRVCKQKGSSLRST